VPLERSSCGIYRAGDEKRDEEEEGAGGLVRGPENINPQKMSVCKASFICRCSVLRVDLINCNVKTTAVPIGSAVKFTTHPRPPFTTLSNMRLI